MRTVRLIGATDEYDSKPGLILKGANAQAPGFMADRDGMTIPHDLLEHVNGPAHIGTVWDELEALGAIWQIRGRHGDLCNPARRFARDVTEDVAADVSRMFPDWIGEKRYSGPGSLGAGTRPHEMDWAFSATIENARKLLAGEDIEPGDAPSVADYFQTALRRMRIGYRKAEKRFGNDCAGYDTFSAIRDAVGEALSRLEIFDGGEYTLRYDRRYAAVTHRYEY